MAAVFDPNDQSSPSAYDASQTALILLDFQKYAVKLCAESGTAAAANAKRLLEWALSEGIMVVHSVADVRGEISPMTKGAGRLREFILAVTGDDDAAEEAVGLAFSGASREFLVSKRPGIVSGLKSEAAEALLVEHGIKSLILCGLSTSGAVLRTAVPASDDGYVVSVVEDACADRKAALHETLMKEVLPSRAHVVNVEEFIGKWKKPSRSRSEASS